MPLQNGPHSPHSPSPSSPSPPLPARPSSSLPSPPPSCARGVPQTASPRTTTSCAHRYLAGVSSARAWILDLADVDDLLLLIQIGGSRPPTARPDVTADLSEDRGQCLPMGRRSCSRSTLTPRPQAQVHDDDDDRRRLTFACWPTGDELPSFARVSEPSAPCLNNLRSPSAYRFQNSACPVHPRGEPAGRL